MNKKGFTLIELLAVIVILAIILLIAMPIVLNVIQEARRGAFQSTSQGMVKTAETEFYRRSLSESPSELYYVFNDGTQTTHDVELEESDEPILEYSGQAPDNGVIHVASNGDIVMWLHDDTHCATKTVAQTEPVVSDDDLAACAAIVSLPLSGFE